MGCIVNMGTVKGLTTDTINEVHVLPLFFISNIANPWCSAFLNVIGKALVAFSLCKIDILINCFLFIWLSLAAIKVQTALENSRSY